MTDGFRHLPHWWSEDEQTKAANIVRELVVKAPLKRPTTPGGQPMKVQVTSAGAGAWWSDEGGYRYLNTQPGGATLPAAPRWLINEAWKIAHACGVTLEPDSVLVNWYDADASLSTHRDESEEDLDAPIVSFSLGAPGVFRVRGPERTDPVSRSVVLESGDVVVMAPPCRNWYHELSRVLPSDTLFTPLKGRGRISILVRKVRK